MTGIAFHALEGALVLSLFLGYLALIGRMKEIRKVFQYHGAEHKSIAAYENDVEKHRVVGQSRAAGSTTITSCPSCSSPSAYCTTAHAAPPCSGVAAKDPATTILTADRTARGSA